MSDNKTIIPAGYRLTIESWENDADNWQTKVVEGLSKSAAEFVVKLCKLHYSQNRYDQAEQGFGNMYEPSDRELSAYHEALERLLQEHKGDLPYEWITESDAIIEYTGELFGYSSDYYTRVFEKVKVEYVPQDIVLEDCTEEFM